MSMSNVALLSLFQSITEAGDTAGEAAAADVFDLYCRSSEHKHDQHVARGKGQFCLEIAGREIKLKQNHGNLLSVWTNINLRFAQVMSFTR